MKSPAAVRLFAAAAVALCLFGAAAGILRAVRSYDTPGGPYLPEQKGLFDFHNGTYYPSMAFVRGVNPYGQEVIDAGYSVTRPAPLFGPSHFLLHAPIAVLPLRAAEILYCGLNLALLAATVWIPLYEIRSRRRGGDDPIVRFPWAIFAAWLAFVLFSRPGHVTLVSGYFTAELAAGTIAVLAWASRRPAAAAVAFVLVCGKPTYAIPVWITLLINRQWKAAAYCAIAGGAATALALAWLLRTHTPAGLVQGMREGQAAHMADPYELPVNTWLRIDWAAIVAKWTETNPSTAAQLAIMLALYAIVAAVVLLRRARRVSEHDARPHSASDDPNGAYPLLGVAASLQLLAVVLFIYHHVYDALILMPALVILGGAAAEWTVRLGFAGRMTAMLLVSTPFWNYLASESLLDRLPLGPTGHAVATSLNTAALTAAAAIIFWWGRWGASRRDNNVAATVPNP